MIRTKNSLEDLLTKGLKGHRLTITKEGFVVITDYVPPEFSQREGTAVLYVYGSGFYDVPKDQLGIAHCLEHMLIERSAGDHTGEDFIRFSDESGSIFNAEVLMRSTKYWVNALNYNLLDGLTALLEQFFEANLLEEEVAVEKGSMKDEVRRIGSIPQDFCRLLAKGILFDVNPFTFTETGTENGIDNITHKRLLEFRRFHNIPQNMTLFVTGSSNYDGDNFAQKADRFHRDVLDRVAKYVDLTPGDSISTIGASTIQPTTKLTQPKPRYDHWDIPDSFYAKVIQNGDFNRYRKAILAVELLTRILDRRMSNSIRVRFGLTYAAGCDYIPSPEGVVISTVSFHDSTREAVINKVHELERDILTMGLPTREFEVQLNRLIHDYRREYREGTSLLRRARDMRFHQQPYEQLMTTLQTLTSDDIKTAANYILSKPYAEVTIGR